MIIFGWRKSPSTTWQGLLPCPFCQGVAIHMGCKVRRWFTLFFIPVVPLWSDRYVLCNRCGYQRQVGAEEEAELQDASQGLLALYELQKQDPEAAERIIGQIDSGRASAADLSALVARARRSQKRLAPTSSTTEQGHLEAPTMPRGRDVETPAERAKRRHRERRGSHREG